MNDAAVKTFPFDIDIVDDWDEYGYDTGAFVTVQIILHQL